MDEITRRIKALFLLLQHKHMDMTEEDGTSEIEERWEAIKCELGSWFIDEYHLYQGSQAFTFCCPFCSFPIFSKKS